MKGWLVLFGLLAGCSTVQSDLSEPAEMTEFPDETVVIAHTNAVPADAKSVRVLPIFTDSSPRNRWAAKFLSHTIGEMCGKRPPVYAVWSGHRHDFNEGLFVGIGEAGRLPDGGFRVVAKDGSVRFSGRADYAVFDWCERYLGMRYYCEGGKCVPERSEIIVPAVDYCDAPVSDHRILTGNETWARIAKAGSEHRGGVQVHAPHDWYRDPELAAGHPEIFETGRTPMLCYGNPATFDCYTNRIERQILGLQDSGGIVDTNRKVVTVSQWDAPVRCTCAQCRAILGSEGGRKVSYSPVLWGHFLPRLARWLAERHPDYMISFLPYINTVEPIEDDVGLATLRNCEAEPCTMPGLALLKDDATREREEDFLRNWQRVTGRKVLNWNYGCWPLEFTSAPYVFGRTIQRHCAAMKDVVGGTFICGGEGDPRIALSLYVWMKCLWNPEIDVEAVYDEFAQRMFGPAARPMRELIALQERCWEREWDSTECTYHNVYEVSFPPEDVERMKGLLDEAWRLVKSDSPPPRGRISAKCATRVKWYASGFSRFFREQEAALKIARAAEPILHPGDVYEMVSAQAIQAKPWVKTTVRIQPPRGEGLLSLTVRCEDPAAARMDFTQIDDDFVTGDDCVTFVFEGMGKARVFKSGQQEGDFPVDSSVTHDSSGWTVNATIRLPADSVRPIRGNVCRWRVGDRRQPKESRLPGSRYEHSRLRTVHTLPDTDPAAFVTFGRKTNGQ